MLEVSTIVNTRLNNRGIRKLRDRFLWRRSFRSGTWSSITERPCPRAGRSPRRAASFDGAARFERSFGRHRPGLEGLNAGAGGTARQAKNPMTYFYALATIFVLHLRNSASLWTFLGVSISIVPLIAVVTWITTQSPDSQPTAYISVGVILMAMWQTCVFFAGRSLASEFS